MSLVCVDPAVDPGETEWTRMTAPLFTVVCPLSVDIEVPLVPKAESVHTPPEGSTGIDTTLLGTRLLPLPLTTSSDTVQPGITDSGTVATSWFKPGNPESPGYSTV